MKVLRKIANQHHQSNLMKKTLCFLTSFFIVVSLSIPSQAASAQSNQGLPQQLERVEAKLDRLLLIEDKLDQLLDVTNTCTMDEFLQGFCDEAPVFTYVNFCFTQGAEVDASMGYGLGLKTIVDLGVGVDTAAIASVYVSAEVPTFVKLPIILPPPMPPMPIGSIPVLPLPTDARVGAAMKLGKAQDTCMQVPIEIPTASLEEVRTLLKDVNMVYEKRFERVLGFGTRVAERREFMQCSGDAFEGILKNQIMSIESEDKTGFLSDVSIKELIRCTELPGSLDAIFSDNGNSLFEALPKPDSLPKYSLMMDSINKIKKLPTKDQITEEVCNALPNSVTGLRKWKSTQCTNGGDKTK